MVPEEIVLTTYFTGRQDPQRKIVQKTNNFSLMKIWYQSIQAVGVAGLVFHDKLDSQFVQKHTTELVQFEHYKLKTKRSMNDERYYCYLEWLKRHSEVKRVFLLDLFDVEFFRNPFLVMDDEKYDIYCGGDMGQYNNQANRKKMMVAYRKPLYENEIKLHAGTCGGTRGSVIRLLEAMVKEFEMLTNKKRIMNLNMAVYNKCVYDLFPKNRIKYGYPLNSKFKHFEKEGDFAIRHK